MILNSNRRAILIVPGLQNRIGHEYGYTAAVANSFDKQGYKVSILGALGATAEVTSLDGFAPVFRHYNDLASGKPSRFIVVKRAWRFLRDLTKVANTLDLGCEDIVFDHTILYTNFAGWLWVWIRHRKNLPNTTLMFRYSLKGDVPSRFPMLRRWLFPLFYRIMFFAFERTSSPPRIVVDTEDLKAEYEHYSKLPISVVPIPLDLPETTKHDKNTFAGSSKHVRLLYLGGIRRGKGFDLLPALAQVIHQNPDLEIDLAIHSGNPPDPFEEPDVGDALEILRKMEEDERISLYETHLDFREYHDLLSTCDAVILPYRTEYYIGQSSNVLVEAISHGKPVVVSEGTWLASSARHSQFGTIFESGNPAEFVAASLEMVSNIDDYTKAANSCSRQWREFHSAENLVRQLRGIR